MLSGGAIDLEHRSVRANGNIRYVCERVPASRGANAGHILGVCQDVTEAKVAAIALQRANEELRLKTDQARSSLEKLRVSDQQRRHLLGAIVSAQEAERRRVANDVHDDSIQMLAAAVLRLGSIRNQITDPALSARLGEFSSSLSRSIESLRRLVFELRPPSLDRDGLDVAFRESVLDWAAEESVSVTVMCKLAARPSTEEGVVLFRIGQEALNNVRKHARARSVSVSLEEVGGGILLRVADDGVGFTCGPRAANSARHFGVANMTERAEQAGGWLRIDHPPSGTGVEAWVPINREPELAPQGGDRGSPGWSPSRRPSGCRGHQAPGEGGPPGSTTSARMDRAGPWLRGATRQTPTSQHHLSLRQLSSRLRMLQNIRIQPPRTDRSGRRSRCCGYPRRSAPVCCRCKRASR